MSLRDYISHVSLDLLDEKLEEVAGFPWWAEPNTPIKTEIKASFDLDLQLRCVTGKSLISKWINLFNNHFNCSALLIMLFPTEPTIIHVMEGKYDSSRRPQIFCILPPPHLSRAQIWARGGAGVSHPGETGICCQLLHLHFRGWEWRVFLPAFVSALLKMKNWEPAWLHFHQTTCILPLVIVFPKNVQ